jgi:hypothetical protein
VRHAATKLPGEPCAGLPEGGVVPLPHGGTAPLEETTQHTEE